MLYSSLERHIAGYRNFAYITRFDRDTRTLGEEKLFLSNGDPLLAFSNVESFFSRAMENSRSEGSNGIIPFFVGYDSIPEFYPVGKVMRSDWPMAASFVPERVLEDSFERESTKALRKGMERPCIDSVMKNKIEELKERVIAGELLQIVISRRFEIQDLDPISLLRYFMEGDRSLYVYYYRIGEFEIVGSSPENVVTRSGRNLEIHPIAGTIRRGKNDDEDFELQKSLLGNPKELREHRMLVDLARNDLGIISEPGSVKVVRSMEVQKFSTVQHIVSTVQSRLRSGLGNYDIVRTVFPAGTVSGAPKIRAIKLIDQYEDCPRGPYAGGLGLMSDETLEMALLIRSAFRSSRETYTQAGGGIVMDSDPETEVMEHYYKAATVMGGVRSESVNH